MLIIIKYSREDEISPEEFKDIKKVLETNHPDHEFILMPKDWEYEVIKYDTNKSITTLEGCSETVSRPSDSRLLSSREPELRIGDTLLGRGYETDSSSIF